MSPWAICASIIESPLTVSAKTSFLKKTSPKIRVNAIGPGPILKAVHQSEDQFQNQRKSTLLERGSDVHEICRTVLYILSSPGLTGQLITLDGGEHLQW